MRGRLPQALLVRGKSTSRHTPAAPAGRLTVGDASAPSPGIMVPGPRSPAQVVNFVVVNSNRLHGRIRAPPRVRLMSPASAVACHARLPGMKALAGASLGRPLRAARRTVSSPHWWDWPQSGSVVTWQHRPVIQCGPRPCQVDRGHSIFLHHRRRRTVVLPARVRQICVLSFICAAP